GSARSAGRWTATSRARPARRKATAPPPHPATSTTSTRPSARPSPAGRGRTRGRDLAPRLRRFAVGSGPPLRVGPQFGGRPFVTRAGGVRELPPSPPFRTATAPLENLTHSSSLGEGTG